MSTMTRDSQRSRVYDAEFVLRSLLEDPDVPMVNLSGVSLTLPPEARFASLESIRDYVERVLYLPAVVAEFGNVGTPAVRSRKGQSSAHYQSLSAEIAIPEIGSRWALRETVVLHELSHHIDHVVHDGGGHGPSFAETYRTLLGAVMGPEIGLALRILYDDNGVRQ